VAVRPCGEKYGNKTYLGILLGEFPLSQIVWFDKETADLTVAMSMQNPAIFVPDLNEIVWGCASFWRKIKSAEDLKAITDADIQNVWYVRALKELSQAEAERAD
jgi:hypothetical protein